MRLAKITGTVTATAKTPELVGAKLLLADLVDGAGTVIEAGCIAIDTVGAGVGDTVIVVTGSAARLPAPVAALPVDASIIGIVDTVSRAG